MSNDGTELDGTAVQSRLGNLLSGSLLVTQTHSLHISVLSCGVEEMDHNILWQVESLGTTFPKQNAEHDFLYRNAW